MFLLGFGQGDIEESVNVLGFDLAVVVCAGQKDFGLEFAVRNFQAVKTLFLVHVASISAHHQFTIDKRNGNIVRIHSRDLDLDDDRVVGFIDIRRRTPRARAGAMLVREERVQHLVHLSLKLVQVVKHFGGCLPHTCPLSINIASEQTSFIDGDTLIVAHLVNPVKCRGEAFAQSRWRAAMLGINQVPLPGFADLANASPLHLPRAHRRNIMKDEDSPRDLVVRGKSICDGGVSMAMALIVHGGAGDIAEPGVEPHRRGAEIAARAGWNVLLNGDSALDAVQAAIVLMENDPAFDAGTGSYLNRDGEVEMDASIMDGRTLDAGAVAGVQRVKNPIMLARRVLESEHTFLIARGAEQFAQERGIALIDNTALRTDATIAKWKQSVANPPPPPSAKYVSASDFRAGGGTVGCVAVDREGNVAAGTSTGGMNFKRAGRVGDSPLIGCGVYADNLLGGASATGWGEAITRVVLSKFAVDALANNLDPQDAARAAIEHLARRVGGTAGIILADRAGRIGFAFNTARMARAYIADGIPDVVSAC